MSGDLTLRNGSKIDRLILQSILFALDGVREVSVLAFIGLVSMCRDCNYEPSAEALDVLIQSGLVQKSNTVRKEVRDVVLSAVDDDMNIGNPLGD